MVVPMRSNESKDLPATDNNSWADINLPVFTLPQQERWPMKISWSDAVELFVAVREYYLLHFDSPEKRLREKNPLQFRLD